MLNQKFADWSNEGKNLWEPFLELQKINGEATEKMIRECIAFCSDNTGTMLKCAQMAPRINRPEDFSSTNIKLFAEQGEKVLECAQNVLQIYQEALKDYCQWADEKVSHAFKNKQQGSSGKSKREED